MKSEQTQSQQDRVIGANVLGQEQLFGATKLVALPPDVYPGIFKFIALTLTIFLIMNFVWFQWYYAADLSWRKVKIRQWNDLQGRKRYDLALGVLQELVHAYPNDFDMRVLCVKSYFKLAAQSELYYYAGLRLLSEVSLDSTIFSEIESALPKDFQEDFQSRFVCTTK